MKRKSCPHPYDNGVSLKSNDKRVIVTISGKVIADTRKAITLNQIGHPALQFIPRRDIDMKFLRKNGSETYCAYKGDCSYFDVTVNDQKKISNVACSYEHPYNEVEEIKDYVAFCEARAVSIIEE